MFVLVVIYAFVGCFFNAFVVFCSFVVEFGALLFFRVLLLFWHVGLVFLFCYILFACITIYFFLKVVSIFFLLVIVRTVAVIILSLTR